VADIAYVALTLGFAYVAGILDSCNRKVVGYAIGRQIDAELTLVALEVAVKMRMPEPGILPSIITLPVFATVFSPPLCLGHASQTRAMSSPSLTVQ